jgi:hypothetical protein
MFRKIISKNLPGLACEMIFLTNYKYLYNVQYLFLGFSDGLNTKFLRYSEGLQTNRAFGVLRNSFGRIFLF